MSFPRYPAYKDSGVEWLGEVPEHWEEKPLKTVTSINDEVLSESVSIDHEIEYVDISSVSLANGIERTESVIFGDAPSRARRIPRDGDVLVSTVRTYLKAIAPVVSPPCNLVASTGFAVVRPQRGIHPGYLKYALQEEHFIQQVISRSTGVSYPAINASDIARIPLSLPKQSEQLAIATFLDRETAKIDALITEQQRLIELLQEKRQAVISHAVTKGLNPDAPMKDSGLEWLGEVPEHWAKVRLRTLFRQEKRQDQPVHQVLSVYRDFGVIPKDSRDDNFNKTPENLSLYQLVNQNDLVINKMKAWQGSLGISPFIGITSPDYIVFTSRHHEFPGYLHFLLRSSAMVSLYRSISNGIRPAQWRIEPTNFLDLPVFLPPFEEQQHIASRINNECSNLDALTSESETSIHLLQERRSALISAAVTGQIDVRGLVPEAEAA